MADSEFHKECLDLPRQGDLIRDSGGRMYLILDDGWSQENKIQQLTRISYCALSLASGIKIAVSCWGTTKKNVIRKFIGEYDIVSNLGEK